MPPRAIPASEDRAAGAPHAGTPGKASALTDERDNDEAVPLRAHRHGEVDDADVPAAVGDANSPFPSAPPWAREIEDSSSPPPFDEEISIPGVPHVVSRAVKVAFTASIAVAGLIGITGGMRALSVRAERRAEEATRRAAMTAVAAPAEVGASSMPVLPPPPVIEIPSTQTVAPPIAEPGTSAAEAAGPTRTVMPPKGEWPVDIVRPSGRSTLVTAAEQALLHGATDRALVLANQAVTTEPQNADAWLTLAAAHRVLGDRAAEREDYRKCIDQAITESVNHCRVLAAR